MKNKKLSIILVSLAVLLVGVVITTIILWPILWKNTDPDTIPTTIVFGTDSDKHNGYADVTLYGAVPNDGKDDTKAFIKAVNTAAGVYVPLGTFDINETVTLRGQNLKGAGIDRTIIRFNENGNIVEMKGASTIDDITLCFADEYITGNEKKGEQIAIKDCGITNGAMLRAVKVSNVGTGYFSDKDIEVGTNMSFSFESVLIDKFSYKAIEIKDTKAVVLRSVRVSSAIGDIDTAVSLGGTFTLESFVFSDIECQYPIEFVKCKSAVCNSIIFEGVKAKSGKLIKSTSSVLSANTVTVTDSEAEFLVDIIDERENGETMGNILSLWSDSENFKIDATDKIKCDSLVLK